MITMPFKLSCQLFVTSNALHFCLAALSLNSWELRAFAYRVLNDYNKLLQDLNTEAFEQSALLIHLFRVLRTSVLEPCQRIASRECQGGYCVSQTSKEVDGDLFLEFLNFVF